MRREKEEAYTPVETYTTLFVRAEESKETEEKENKERKEER